ncbi:MAG: lipoprotein [Azoarcus sp.]|jgi:predicted small lipoprotein YifL|nr:lipoprotein [Azoarcus sp.]
MRATIALTVLAGTLFLSACGIKGPLFLPPVPEEDRTVVPVENGDHGEAATTMSDDASQP